MGNDQFFVQILLHVLKHRIEIEHLSLFLDEMDFQGGFFFGIEELYLYFDVLFLALYIELLLLLVSGGFSE